MDTDHIALELHQFPHSHYNEKARWALDFKSVPHKRISYLPGPHTAAMRKLAGTTETPVLKVGGLVVAGSAAIIDALEANYPDPPLYPSDTEQRKEALALQSWFDEEVGPGIRRALFAELMQELGYLCKLFASEKPLHTRLFYRAALPIARGTIKSSMNINEPGAVEAGYRVTQAALDRVAAQAGSSGYLVGDSFSVADLTAAALLAPACNPPHPDMEFPLPRPARIDAWFGRWAAHPGAQWVRTIYRKHRPRRVLPLRAAA
ncbi:glutathione S-transferase family protein [Parvibaculum sp.]|uniref:glutathione S-transferase family protein n=1 Tax=Parvibaculum sp. TaxID=2024848 RepID=UPI001B18BEC0|nr:glutathione S-transferase family protein [Parvibaculum sp.]MBO6633000.1 glutathione S-transferase [Parvibaculum sp.]MBO6679393.1 glutathione S-transferase [Parvibaculum sp.]MBO6684424.1 glutathione S-transferase [Parvibaculum sp.]MBO6904220.1 glutathione S-transferase [Parvibaculum sp.]